MQARHRQCGRYADAVVRTNAQLTAGLMARHCALDAAASRLLAAAVTRLALSARGYDRVRRVARTIADLAGRDEIGADAVAEALQFRMC
jgi:magnesium chelatase family protein